MQICLKIYILICTCTIERESNTWQRVFFSKILTFEQEENKSRLETGSNMNKEKFTLVLFKIKSPKCKQYHLFILLSQKILFFTGLFSSRNWIMPSSRKMFITVKRISAIWNKLFVLFRQYLPIIYIYFLLSFRLF